MIEIKNISKSFGDRKVIDDVSFTFEKGKTNLIIGESGSGKTTVMKLMVGLHEVDSGEVLYDGENFPTLGVKEKQEVRKKIGMLFQGGALFDSQTLEENVRFPLDMFTTMTKEEKLAIRKLYLQAMKLTKLTGVKYVVDHDYPLHGKEICGLHVLANLRIITQEENLRKSNKLLDSPTVA